MSAVGRKTSIQTGVSTVGRRIRFKRACLQWVERLQTGMSTVGRRIRFKLACLQWVERHWKCTAAGREPLVGAGGHLWWRDDALHTCTQKWSTFVVVVQVHQKRSKVLPHDHAHCVVLSLWPVSPLIVAHQKGQKFCHMMMPVPLFPVWDKFLQHQFQLCAWAQLTQGRQHWHVQPGQSPVLCQTWLPAGTGLHQWCHCCEFMGLFFSSSYNRTLVLFCFLGSQLLFIEVYIHFTGFVYCFSVGVIIVAFAVIVLCVDLSQSTGIWKEENEEFRTCHLVPFRFFACLIVWFYEFVYKIWNQCIIFLMDSEYFQNSQIVADWPNISNNNCPLMLIDRTGRTFSFCTCSKSPWWWITKATTSRDPHSVLQALVTPCLPMSTCPM